MNLHFLFWDYQILQMLLGSLILALLILLNYKKTKKNLKPKQKILRLFLVVFFIFIFTSIFYGSFIEPRIIQTNYIPLNFNQTEKTEQITIVQISDLHSSYYKGPNFYQNLVEKIIKISPDIIVITGDFIAFDEKGLQNLEPLQKIAQQFPTFAITGNHEYNLNSPDDEIIDYTPQVMALLEKLNISLIDNQTRKIQIDGSTFYLAGIKEIWAQDNNNEILHQLIIDRTKTTILLAHNPDIILEENSQNFRLILSGHTHGGQLRLPFIGSISALPTILGRDYDKGLFELENKNYLYINSGAGESGPRARLFCPPEISVFEIDL